MVNRVGIYMVNRRRRALAPITHSVAKRDPADFLEKKFESFLEHYSLTALRGESMEMSGLTRQQLRRLLEDPVKAEQFALAEEEAMQSLTDEAVYRATKGVITPIFDKSGRRVATVRKKSDNLLMFLMKKRDPTYRDNFAPPPQSTDELDYDTARERIASRIAGIRQRLRSDPEIIDQ